MIETQERTDHTAEPWESCHNQATTRATNPAIAPDGACTEADSLKISLACVGADMLAKHRKDWQAHE